MGIADKWVSELGDTPKPKKYWMGTPPTVCDIDQTPIKTVFIDGATKQGPWANMCPKCARVHGRGLGTGKGQEYTKQDDGKWLKTGG